MKRYSKSKIDKALALLEEVARDKKQELVSHMSGKYTAIKELFTEEAGHDGKSVRNAFKDAIEKGEHVIKDKIHQGEDFYQTAEKTLRKKVKEVDKYVCENPYSSIVGLGLASLVLGYLFANYRHKGSL